MTFEEQIQKNGSLFYTTVGDSMEPLLHQGRDVVLIVSAPQKLKRGDTPLYRRDNGRYVLHRIVRTTRLDNGETGYICCGDNRTALEQPITSSQIVGLLHSVTRKGKIIKVSDLRYKLYWNCILLSRPIRNILRHVFPHYKKRSVGHPNKPAGQ